MGLAENVDALAARVSTEFNTVRGEAVMSATARGIEVISETDYAALELAGDLVPNTIYAKTLG